MKSFEYVVTDELGLHARPAGLLVRIARRYVSRVTVIKGGLGVDAKDVMGLMSLGIRYGQKIEVSISGQDEDAAFEEIRTFFADKL